jgi:serine/threonine protein phosphatase PrpC
MGCSGSKLAPAEAANSAAKQDINPHDRSRSRPRQARLSLAGAFNQHEDMTEANNHGAAAKFDNASGLGTIPAAGPGRPVLRYAYVSQRGHYPDHLNKANQDAVFMMENARGVEGQHFFGVLDGHGEYGAECAEFVRNKLPALLISDGALLSDPKLALHRAAVEANEDLHRASVDDSLSGTTACIALVQNEHLYVANVGDSRAVLAAKQRVKATEDDYTSRNGSNDSKQSLEAAESTPVAVQLSQDQTPFRQDERERVKRYGARVLTLDQIEGRKDDSVPCWADDEADCDGDPPRLWAANGTYPGTAFTRSLGDSVAEGLGVIADPEVSSIKLTPDHAFLIVATDGVWEFISSQAAVNVVAACSTPQEAARTLVNAAYKVWLRRENRTDDITVIVISFGWPT